MQLLLNYNFTGSWKPLTNVNFRDHTMFEVSDITHFPKPYSFESSPYSKSDFNDITKQKINDCTDFSNINKVFKIIVVGDVSVGKTCIVNRFCHQLFDGNYKATIGVDFEVQILSILGVSVTLQIWDTAGQEKFKCIAQSYYRGAHAIVVAFDFSSMLTLSHCESWLKEALNANSMDNTLIFLVGNKVDLLSLAAYSNMEDIGMKIAQNLCAEYWSVSAKNGLNVNQMFVRIASLLLDTHFVNENEATLNDSIRIGSNLVAKKKTNKKKISRCACNQ